LKDDGIGNILFLFLEVLDFVDIACRGIVEVCGGNLSDFVFVLYLVKMYR
jgi:hypothetical protein